VIRVVLDTNVYISALEFGGVPRQVFQLGLGGLFELITSDVLLDELLRVLGEAFSYDEERLRRLRTLLTETAVRVVIPTETIATASDPDDDRVLECAVAAQAQFIVTGEKGLLQLTSFRDVRIVSPASFLKQSPWA
jgi:putative PIN family toxin of toxin-antitoxin system